jgi:hypothetical protein
MSWVRARSHRRLIAAIALLGVAFYALLLPGHLTSQFSAQLYRADVGIFADSMCATDGSNPALPATSCPICKGLAAFQLAVAPPNAVALPTMPHATAALVVARDDVADLASPSPRSRGPPLSA